MLHPAAASMGIANGTLFMTDEAPSIQSKQIKGASDTYESLAITLLGDLLTTAVLSRLETLLRGVDGNESTEG